MLHVYILIIIIYLIMKFRFNGDADCPDWILTEIYSLSKLSSIKLKVLCQIVALGIIKPPLQEEKVNKLFADSKLDSDINLKACIACITYLISSAARYNCDSSALQSELQQLGLPREHSTSIKKIFDEHSSDLIETFKKQSLRINNLEDVTASVNPEIGCVSIRLQVAGEEKSFTVAPDTIDLLLSDLEHVQDIMVQLKEAM